MYLWLCLDDGSWRIADVDERLWVIVIIVLRLSILISRDDHHRLYVLGQRSCMKEVRRRLRSR